jgi:hypothetical protein
MYLYRPHVLAGGLISYGPDLPDMFRRCGVYVGRILGGTKPADLPIERPSRFELIVNLKTARPWNQHPKQSWCAPTDRVAVGSSRLSAARQPGPVMARAQLAILAHGYLHSGFWNR